MNSIEIVGKTSDNKIEVAVRSPNERDLHGTIDDPYAHIMGIATLMGYELTIQDTSSNMASAAQVPASASGGPQVPVSPSPKDPPQITGTEETTQL